MGDRRRLGVDYRAWLQYCSNSRELSYICKISTYLYVILLQTLQIGYYHLCGVGPSVLQGTYFQLFQEVYAGAWSRIVRAIETAHRHGIGVLLGETFTCLNFSSFIDLKCTPDPHAAPGKQNNDAHG